ncbi:hypothetical protein RHMOL_Rhmol01G0192500 [Rhododendron molle]|uniref:Uncharacterized protein n=1 Tax=Rhododendron molle TaxID=49168 RepID=A0ACC0Q4I3_RHOML|nr:hypothetical protein RHMOL_Rhmol01G0192500 [Rhododendron molle]
MAPDSCYCCSSCMQSAVWLLVYARILYEFYICFVADGVSTVVVMAIVSCCWLLLLVRLHYGPNDFVQQITLELMGKIVESGSFVGSFDGEYEVIVY